MHLILCRLSASLTVSTVQFLGSSARAFFLALLNVIIKTFEYSSFLVTSTFSLIEYPLTDLADRRMWSEEEFYDRQKTIIKTLDC